MLLIVQRSWPDEDAIRMLKAPPSDPEEACELLRSVCVVLNKRFTSLRLFWKDESLRWLGSCERFARDAGKKRAEELIGLSDDSPGIPFQRQAAKYHRDDKRVMDTGAAFDIVERQDRDAEEVVWLRTSKVAIYDQTGVCGLVGGYDEVGAMDAQQILSSARLRSSAKTLDLEP